MQPNHGVRGKMSRSFLVVALTGSAALPLEVTRMKREMVESPSFAE